MTLAKSLAFIQRNDTRFAVGDFYPVLSVFSYQELGGITSPFLLLDHIGKGTLPANSYLKGVNPHPHRGFETVTLVFSGELEHRDSTGAGGYIAAGEVQWMTAGAGVQHIERFSPAFRQTGGQFEMIQLWVNLPAKDKLSPAHYQLLQNQDLPNIPLAPQKGTLRVIAGQYQQQTSPVHTYSPMNIYDIELKAGQRITLPAKHNDTTLIYLRYGELSFAEDEEHLTTQGLAVMSSHGENVTIHAHATSYLLFLTAQPLYEPISGHGFVVMNTNDEVMQAYQDMQDHPL